MRGQQRRVAEHRRIRSVAGAGDDHVRAFRIARVQPEIVSARDPQRQRVVVARAAADEDPRAVA